MIIIYVLVKENLRVYFVTNAHATNGDMPPYSVFGK